MKFSFLITGKKYTKYDISKNTFGEDLNSPAPTTVPLHVLGQGLGSNSNLGEGEDFQPRQSCRKGGTSRELPFISPPPKTFIKHGLKGHFHERKKKKKKNSN